MIIELYTQSLLKILSKTNNSLQLTHLNLFHTAQNKLSEKAVMHHGSIFLLLVLPIGSQAWAWTVAVICTALLHYMGKITVDMEIHQRDGAR